MQHGGFWHVLKNLSIEEGFIQIVILYMTSHSVVLLNSQVGYNFKTTVGICQICLLSLTLFDPFLDHIMGGTFQDFLPTISTGGELLTTYASLRTLTFWAVATPNCRSH